MKNSLLLSGKLHSSHTSGCPVVFPQRTDQTKIFNEHLTKLVAIESIGKSRIFTYIHLTVDEVCILSQDHLRDLFRRNLQIIKSGQPVLQHTVENPFQQPKMKQNQTIDNLPSNPPDARSLGRSSFGPFQSFSVNSNVLNKKFKMNEI